MKWPTPDQIAAARRHVYTAAGTAATIALAFGLAQGDATAIGEAVQKIGDGVAAIALAVGALVPVINAIKASRAASRANRMQAFDKDPEIERLKTVPGTEAAKEAAAIPGNKVI